MKIHGFVIKIGWTHELGLVSAEDLCVLCADPVV